MAKIITATKNHVDLVVKEIKSSELGEVYFENKNIDSLIAGAVDKSEILLLVDDKTFIGLLWYKKNGTFGKYPFLHMLLVKEKFRNKGVGTKLLTYFEKKLTSEHKKVFLMVADYNEGAKTLYQKHGYEEVGVLTEFFRDGVDETLMMKDKSRSGKEVNKKEVVTGKKLDGLRTEKVGEYVKRTLPSVFENIENLEMLETLLSADESKTMFNLDLPVLKKITGDISDDRMENDIPKYYASPVVKVEDAEYLIVNSWSSKHEQLYKNWLNTVEYTDPREVATQVWKKIFSNLGNSKKELKTLKKFPNWFTVSAEADMLVVEAAVKNKPSAKIENAKKLYFKKFLEIYPLYLRRDEGEDVSEEATKLTIDQVYFYSIIENLGK